MRPYLLRFRIFRRPDFSLSFFPFFFSSDPAPVDLNRSPSPQLQPVSGWDLSPPEKTVIINMSSEREYMGMLCNVGGMEVLEKIDR